MAVQPDPREQVVHSLIEWEEDCKGILRDFRFNVLNGACIEIRQLIGCNFRGGRSSKPFRYCSVLS